MTRKGSTACVLWVCWEQLLVRDTSILISLDTTASLLLGGHINETLRSRWLLCVSQLVREEEGVL